MYPIQNNNRSLQQPYNQGQSYQYPQNISYLSQAGQSIMGLQQSQQYLPRHHQNYQSMNNLQTQPFIPSQPIQQKQYTNLIKQQQYVDHLDLLKNNQYQDRIQILIDQNNALRAQTEYPKYDPYVYNHIQSTQQTPYQQNGGIGLDNFIRQQEIIKAQELRNAIELMNNRYNSQPVIQPPKPNVIVINGGGGKQRKQNTNKPQKQFKKIPVESSSSSSQSSSSTPPRTRHKRPQKFSPPINDMFSSLKSVRSQVQDDGPPTIKFKLLTLRNLEDPNQIDLCIRNGLVDYKDIINGPISGQPLAEQRVILGRESYGGVILYDYEKSYSVNLIALKSTRNAAELLRIYWYNSFYDDNSGAQAGWILSPLFREEKGKIVLNKGKFVQNMYLPPTQRPPFNERLAQLGKTVIEYIIMAHNESEINLPEFDEAEEQEDDQDSIKLFVSIKKITNAYIQGDPIRYKLTINNNNQIVPDRFNSTRGVEGDLKLLSKNRNEFQFQHNDFFNVSEQLLRKRITRASRKEAVITVWIYNDDKSLDMKANVPLFGQNPQKINIGLHDAILIGQGSDESITQIKISHTPENFVEKLSKQFNPHQGILCNLIQIDPFTDKFDILYRVSLLNLDQVYVDQDGLKCMFAINQNIERNKKFKRIDLQTKVQFPVNYKYILNSQGKLPRNLKSFGILIEFIQRGANDRVFAWYMHQLFTFDGKLNRGMFDTVLWKPPVVQSCPVDWGLNQIEYSDYTGKLGVEEEIKKGKGEAVQEIQISSGVSDISNLSKDLITVTVIDLKDNNKQGKVQVNVAVVQNGQFMPDAQNQPILMSGGEYTWVDNCIKIDEDFDLKADLSVMRGKKIGADNFFIVFSFKNEQNKSLYWSYFSFLEIDFYPKIGMHTLDLLNPPLVKPTNQTLRTGGISKYPTGQVNISIMFQMEGGY